MKTTPGPDSVGAGEHGLQEDRNEGQQEFCTGWVTVVTPETSIAYPFAVARGRSH